MGDIQRMADEGTVSLFIAAQGGQAEASDLLARRLRTRLLAPARWVKRRLGRGLDLETLELADDALLDVLRHPPAGGLTGSPHLFGVLINRMQQLTIGRLRHDRAVKRGGGVPRQPLSEAADVVRSEDRADGNLALLEEALDRLKQEHPQFHQAVALRTLEAYDWDRVAQTMAVSVATARRHWCSGLAWLRNFLEADTTGESDGPARESPRP
jgi:DNA-directed RNA polymerase specialized sigma24 family protein